MFTVMPSIQYTRRPRTFKSLWTWSCERSTNCKGISYLFLLTDWWLVLNQTLSLILAFSRSPSHVGCSQTTVHQAEVTYCHLKHQMIISRPDDFASFTLLVSILPLNNILNQNSIFSLPNKFIQLALAIFARSKVSPLTE